MPQAPPHLEIPRRAGRRARAPGASIHATHVPTAHQLRRRDHMTPPTPPPPTPMRHHWSLSSLSDRQGRAVRHLKAQARSTGIPQHRGVADTVVITAVVRSGTGWNLVRSRVRVGVHKRALRCLSRVCASTVSNNAHAGPPRTCKAIHSPLLNTAGPDRVGDHRHR